VTTSVDEIKHVIPSAFIKNSGDKIGETVCGFPHGALPLSYTGPDLPVTGLEPVTSPLSAM
jgi:hypothetical protein